MKILAILTLAFFSANAFSSVIECNNIPTNEAGITHVQFSSHESRYADFNKMIISFDNDNSVVLRATNSEAIGNVATTEQTKFALFSNTDGFVTLKYNFYTLTRDSRNNGRSLKNGVNINLILPSVSKRVNLDCIRIR